MGDSHEIRRLVEEEGLKPGHTYHLGLTALHESCECGHVEATKQLLQLGAEVNNQVRDRTVWRRCSKVEHRSVGIFDTSLTNSEQHTVRIYQTKKITFVQMKQITLAHVVHKSIECLQNSRVCILLHNCGWLLASSLPTDPYYCLTVTL